MTRTQPRGAVSWALYDLANTIYSMNVVTLFFAQWVTVDQGRQDFWYSAFYGGSMAMVAVTLPYLGLWSDRGGRRVSFLAIFTAVAVAATAALGWLTRPSGHAGFLLAMTVFALSNYAFQGGLVFYNSLLPSVSTPARRGFVSGLGVALGYIGAFIGMMLVVPFAEGKVPILGWEPSFITAGGRSAAFLPTAVLFGLFSLPLFFRVRDRKGTPGKPPSWGEAFTTLKTTLADTRRYPGVTRFLIGNFFLLDGIHTAIIFMAVYAEKVVGLPDTAKATFFMVATLPAILGSFVAGWLSDRIGPRRVFIWTAWLWVLLPMVIAAARSTVVFYCAGAGIGILLGSIWTTTRPLLLNLTPEGEEGKLFGLYAFCNKSAAVLGPQVWALVVLLGDPLGAAKYRLAIVSLAVIAAIGATIVMRVPERRPENGDEPLTG